MKRRFQQVIGGDVAQASRSNEDEWEQGECFDSRIFVGRLQNYNNIKNIREFFQEKEPKVESKITELLEKHHLIKTSLSLSLKYLIKKGDEEKLEDFYFNLSLEPFYQVTIFNEWYAISSNKFLGIMEEFERKGSGATVDQINHLELNIAKYEPLKGGTYIPLPKNLQSKKACINIQNEDDFCFAYCILAFFYPTNVNTGRVNSYPPNFHELFNFNQINFPTPLKDIAKFENQNNNISINVYTLSDKNLIVGPIYYTKNKKERHINLLLLKEGEKQHYVLIKNLARLCSKQISNHNGKIIICVKCLQYFYQNEKYESHLELCENFNTVKVTLPTKENSVLKFKNFNRQEPVPFVVYADFECFTKKVTTDEFNTSTMSLFQHHQAYAVAFKVVCSFDDSYSFYMTYCGIDSAKWFINQLVRLTNMVESLYQNIIPLVMTEEDEITFNTSTSCHICKKILTIEGGKVQDHDHLTGKFRGAACNSCNLNYQLPNFIPVLFHNGSHYDFNLFIQELGYDDNEIKVIPINNENYISFSKKVNSLYLRFVDSCKFMHGSLDKLVDTLDASHFKFLDDHYKTNQNLHLLKRKGIFPYDYVDGWNKLKDESLPTKDQFYNQLTEKHISDEDYAHAQNVWDCFGVKNLEEYAELYLKCDVLLLACVFENYRKITLSTHGLDPACYYTVPGLTFDAMLKVTEIELELITDINILNFIEQSIRGGLTLSIKRYAESNNKYMQDYNPAKPDSSLIYLDANNLYGYAMSQPLPYKDFKFLPQNEVTNFDVNIPADGEVGYFLEVDIEYPQDLHYEHNDYPFLPEHRVINKQSKLVTTFYKKEKYVVHLRNLQQALAHGLKLVNIHRILSFKQSLWMKKYIDLNTRLRTEATTEIEKAIYKDYNNCLFGKTMESVRKRRDCRLVCKYDGRRGFRNLVCNPLCKTFKIIAPNLVVVEHKIAEVLYDKPIFIGATVLELSKHLMYEFHYDYVKKNFKNVNLLYTDTDSFVYEIFKTPGELDIYERIQQDNCLPETAENKNFRFDTSDYPLDNKYKITRMYKKVMGVMKDECKGQLITHFCSLRAKMYSFVMENEDKSHKKAKGITKSCLAKLTFEDYVNTLFTSTSLYGDMYSIQNKKFKLFTIRQKKKTLSADDDKRFILPDQVHTLALGHRDISSYCELDD